MVTYAAALVLGLGGDKLDALREYDHRRLSVTPALKPAPIRLYLLPDGRQTPLPGWSIGRLERMAEFTADLTKPHGHVCQIGDNDSGQFLTDPERAVDVGFGCTGATRTARFSRLPDEAAYWAEDHLDHRHLVSAINRLMGARIAHRSWPVPVSAVVQDCPGTMPSYRGNLPSRAETIEIRTTRRCRPRAMALSARRPAQNAGDRLPGAAAMV
jgi:hypothetical protein